MQSRPSAEVNGSVTDCRAEWHLSVAEDIAMGRLTIKYVQRLTPGAADLAPDVVEVYIGSSAGKVGITIGRHGFILADPVMHMITERIRRLAIATAGANRPVGQRIGLSPAPNSDWREFLDDLLQKCDSWAFFVNPGGAEGRS
jgi:hypothetical protein